MNLLTRQLGIKYPIICGAMYPCSNPELVAAVSHAGAIGIVQPLSFIYVYKRDFREALRDIKARTPNPFGMNVLVEKSSKVYEERMKAWVDIALEEGCRFFVTALGNPAWVIEKTKPYGAIVYHDVTERKWALKAREYGVDGLICVNNRAGGHAGTRSPAELYSELSDLKLPLVCAGGVGDEVAFKEALELGYLGVQMGTRFIATTECGSHSDYKQAILQAQASDIVRTERITGIPLSVIKTPYVEKIGLKVGPLARLLFKNSYTKPWIRSYYNLRGLWSMRKSSLGKLSTKNFYQAGKSVAGITNIESVAHIIERFAKVMPPT